MPTIDQIGRLRSPLTITCWTCKHRVTWSPCEAPGWAVSAWSRRLAVGCGVRPMVSAGGGGWSSRRELARCGRPGRAGHRGHDRPGAAPHGQLQCLPSSRAHAADRGGRSAGRRLHPDPGARPAALFLVRRARGADRRAARYAGYGCQAQGSTAPSGRRACGQARAHMPSKSWPRRKPLGKPAVLAIVWPACATPTGSKPRFPF